MSSNGRPYTFTVPTHHGSVPLTGVVLKDACPHCRKEMTADTLLAAIGPPHHILVHWDCWQYYQFNSAYPHGRPLDHIKRR